MSVSQGFLSPANSTSIINIRRDFAPWFDVAESFNNLGMRVLPAVKADKTNNQQLVAAALYGRTLTSFQASYILTERGMLADARTVLRAAVETVIVLSAVVKDATVCDLLIERHFWHLRKLVNAWLNDPQAIAEMTAENVENLKAVLADVDKNHPRAKDLKTDPLVIASLAQKTGGAALYNAVYRPTSGDAAHTSVDALSRQIQADANNDIQGLKFGPDVTDLPATLSDAMSVLGHALDAVQELFPLSQFNEDLAKCIAAWKALGLPTDYKLGSNTN